MSVEIYQVNYPVEQENGKRYITVGTDKVLLNVDTTTNREYVMMYGNTYYVKGGRRRSRRKRSRKYKK
jgi:hypothetical protein